MKRAFTSLKHVIYYSYSTLTETIHYRIAFIIWIIFWGLWVKVRFPGRALEICLWNVLSANVNFFFILFEKTHETKSQCSAPRSKRTYITVSTSTWLFSHSECKCDKIAQVKIIGVFRLMIEQWWIKSCLC